MCYKKRGGGGGGWGVVKYGSVGVVGKEGGVGCRARE